MNKAQAFFILSNPRSGSSLLRVICDSHEKMTVPPECGFIEWWYSKYKDWSIEDNSNRLAEFCNDLKSSRKFETWDFDFSYFKKIIKEEEPKNYAELSALVHISYGMQRDKKLFAWGNKNNYFIHNTDPINQLYPTSKFIFIVRDGRDVATSYLALQHLNSDSPYKPNLPTKLDLIAKEWNENNLKVADFLSSIKEDRVLQLRYEDLVMNMASECYNICSFLGIPFDPGMLEYYKLNLEPKETLDWKKKTLKKPDKLTIGKYKDILNKEEEQLFNEIAEEGLKKFGYEFH